MQFYGIFLYLVFLWPIPNFPCKGLHKDNLYPKKNGKFYSYLIQKKRKGFSVTRWLKTRGLQINIVYLHIPLQSYKQMTKLFHVLIEQKRYRYISLKKLDMYTWCVMAIFSRNGSSPTKPGSDPLLRIYCTFLTTAP